MDKAIPQAQLKALRVENTALRARLAASVRSGKAAFVNAPLVTTQQSQNNRLEPTYWALVAQLQQVLRKENHNLQDRLNTLAQDNASMQSIKQQWQTAQADRQGFKHQMQSATDGLHALLAKVAAQEANNVSQEKQRHEMAQTQI